MKTRCSLMRPCADARTIRPALAALALLALSLLGPLGPATAQDAPAAKAADQPKPGIPCLVLKPDGAPLADARVTLFAVWYLEGKYGGKTDGRFRTDGTGRFNMRVTELDEVQIEVSAKGVGCLKTEPIVFPKGAPPAEQTLRLKMGGRVTGRVIDQATGRPLSGASVQYHRPESGRFPQRFIAADGKLDAEGRFVIDTLPEGNLGLYANLNGYQGDTIPLTITDGQTVENQEIKLLRLATLRCIVLKGDGTPLATAAIRVVSRTAAERREREFTTDADGAFEVQGLPYEKTRLLFLAKGVGYATPEPLTIVQGQELAPLTVKLSPGSTVSGTAVEKQTGKPLPGASVGFRYAEDYEKPLGLDINIDSIGSDAEGRWRQTVLMPGHWRVLCGHQRLRGLSTEIDVVEGQDIPNLRLEFIGQVTVTGLVLAADGATPVAKAAVSCLDQNATTDAQGKFAVTVMPDDNGCTLTVKAEGLAENTQTITFPDYRAPAALRIVLVQGAVIGGRVVDLDTGQPVAGQEVVIASLKTCDTLRHFIDSGRVHQLEPGHLHEVGRGGVYRTTTDAQGNYVVSSARSDKYVAVAFPKDALPALSESFEVTAGGAVDVPNLQITKRPLGFLSGRLLMADGAPLTNARIAVLMTDGRSLQQVYSAVREGGRYYLPLGKSGTTRFLVAVEGYALIDRTVQVPDRNVAVEEDLKLQAVKSDAVISGRVLLSDGKTPAVGVSVRPYVHNRPWAGNSNGSSQSNDEYVVHVSPTAVTAADGSFRLEGLPPAVYGLTFDPKGQRRRDDQPAEGNAAGYMAALREKVEVAESAQIGGIEITLAQGGAVAGQILDAATGQPIAKVHVYVYRTSSGGPFGGDRPPFWQRGDTSTQTDDQGKFRLDGLPPGAYQLNVSAQGYDQPRSGFWGPKTLQVKAGETIERTLRLKAR